MGHEIPTSEAVKNEIVGINRYCGDFTFQHDEVEWKTIQVECQETMQGSQLTIELRNPMPTELEIFEVTYEPNPVHGHWSNWGEWSDCFQNHGSWIQKSKRTCDNPARVNNGMTCSGSSEQFKDCPPVNGNWSQWSSWTECKEDKDSSWSKE